MCKDDLTSLVDSLIELSTKTDKEIQEFIWEIKSLSNCLDQKANQEPLTPKGVYLAGDSEITHGLKKIKKTIDKLYQ